MDDRDVTRSALGRPASSVEAANSLIVPRNSSIHRAGPGDVVLLKGDRFAGNDGRGAVHRAPPIEGTGARRLVLILDPP